MKKLWLLDDWIVAVFLIDFGLFVSGPSRLITEGAGFGWDGVAYGEVARQCWTGDVHAEAPFVYRIGTPCLARLLSSDILTGFRYINSILFGVAIGGFVLLLRRYITAKWLRVALIVTYALAFHAPLRFTQWAPAESVDSGFHAVMVLALLALDRSAVKAGRLLVPIVFVGVFFREVALIFPVALFARALVTYGRGGWKFGAWIALPSLTAGVLASVLVRLIAHPTNHESLLWNAIYWSFEKGPAEYLYSVFVAFGPILAVLVAAPSSTRRVAMWAGDFHLAAVLALVAALAFIGGSDTWRFLYWGAPVVLIFVGQVLQQEFLPLRRVWAPLVLLALLQLLSMRVGMRAPDSVETPERPFPLLTPIHASWNKRILPVNPDRRMSAVALAEYLAVTAGLALWLRFSIRKHYRTEAVERKRLVA